MNLCGWRGKIIKESFQKELMPELRLADNKKEIRAHIPGTEKVDDGA